MEVISTVRFFSTKRFRTKSSLREYLRSRKWAAVPPLAQFGGSARLTTPRHRLGCRVALTAHRAVEQECNAPLAVALFDNKPQAGKLGRAAQGNPARTMGLGRRACFKRVILSGVTRSVTQSKASAASVNPPSNRRDVLIFVMLSAVEGAPLLPVIPSAVEGAPLLPVILNGATQRVAQLKNPLSNRRDVCTFSLKTDRQTRIKML